jgi:hypothetical protein
MRKLFLPGLVGLSLLLLAALGLAEARGPAGRLVSSPLTQRVKQPRIAFKTDGKDVVASIQVMANNSPHALWTSYERGTDNVVALRYCLIQNPDRFVRSVKTVTIEWRLKNFAVMPTPLLSYRVDDLSITPNSQELNALVPQLQHLIADKADKGVRTLFTTQRSEKGS